MRMGLRGPTARGGKACNVYLKNETVGLLKAIGRGSASAAIEALAALAFDDPCLMARAQIKAEELKKSPPPTAPD